MAFTYDKAATAKRISTLSQYFEANVLHGQNFICKHFEACRDSHNGPFHEGLLHHVGQHYDLFDDGVPFRVVVVGQEYGGTKSKVSLPARYKQVIATGHDRRFKTSDGYPSRNPHMRGTTSVLRLLFGGEPGLEYASEFIRFADKTRCHIYDAFGLVNYLLCAAHAMGSTTRGKSTRVMKANCGEHFRAVLAILEPTVIIVQGKGIWPWVSNSFDTLDLIQDDLYQGRIFGTKSLVAAFTHPSTSNYQFNWGVNEQTPYLHNVVSPTVRLIRSLLLNESVAVL